MIETNSNTNRDEATHGTEFSPRVPVTTKTNLKDIRIATDATISPDGKRAAFVVAEWVPEMPRQRARIWAIKTDGSSEAGALAKGM